MAVKELHFETGGFNRAVERMLLELPRDLETVMKGAAKGIVKTIILQTPPGGDGVTGQAAKKQGEAAVEGDIKRIFRVVPKRRVDTVNLKKAHKSRRGSRGRVGKIGQVFRVAAGSRSRYIREQKKKVGFLAGGFNAAAAKLGYKPPAWIWRHNSPGAVSIKVSGRGINVRLTNKVRYAGNVKGMERRIDFAMALETKKIIKQVDFAVARRARKRGFKTKR